MKSRHCLSVPINMLTLVVCVVLFSSCIFTKDLNKNYTYFQKGLDSVGLRELDSIGLNIKETTIQSNDLLSILVYSQTINQEQTAVFNIANSSSSGSTQGLSGGAQGYKVSLIGTIDMPILGTIKVAGLTQSDLQKILVEKLTPYVKNPSVIIKLMQFNVNVLGEVKSPGIHSFQSEKVTILDAISSAEDLTDYGRREDILVIREEDGKRAFYKIDLRTADLFKSPVYQLRPNDVIYVSPNKNKLSMLNVNPEAQRKTGLLFAVTSTLIGLISLVVNLSR
ncbi:polysaccharide biosynthesis/export family protein [Flavisolibacter tropicus]|nr:polysaccharide biosynthesis/export family protein [Flavisolibacter tropicus]